MVGIFDFCGDFLSQVAGNAFEHHRERAGFFGGAGVGHQFAFVALNFVAAERVDALRPQAAVGHDGNAGADERGDRFGLFDAPFELNGLAAGFLQNSAGVFNRAVSAEVEAGERHVDDNERVLDGSADHFGVVDHFVERDGQRAVVALDDHRHAVANQDAFDAGGIHEAAPSHSRRP